MNQKRPPPDLTAEDIQAAKSLRLTQHGSGPRAYSVIRAVKYLCRYNIKGAFVECGVGRGGSALLMMKAILNAKAPPREIYLCDTYAGMPEPEEIDIPIDPNKPDSANLKDGAWWGHSLKAVKHRIHLKTNYPRDKMHYVVGQIEDTVPDQVPKKIALLHLDTDWYRSTKHGLETLFPRIVPNGIILLHDYGVWAGARKAIDDYFREHNTPILLHAVDHTALVGVKTGQWPTN